MTHNETVAAYMAAFIDGLAKTGVVHAVVSPGSRSTPLAMMLEEHPSIRVWIHVDERSAGFFALGMAKASHKPVVLVCSSGTATANYFPAVVEANQSRVPLIVCTADRPHELRDVGAPQAINQLQLYGSFAKYFMEMPLPEASEAMLRYARTMAGRAAAMACIGPAGPVHVNFPLREPLTPVFDADTVWQSGMIEKMETSDHSDRGTIQVSAGNRLLPGLQIERLARELMQTERGILVCGPMDDPNFPEVVNQLAHDLQYPIFADPLSQVRFGHHDKSHVIDGYDTLLRNQDVVAHIKPDVIIRFGAMPISKAYLQYLNRYPECRQIIIDADQGWLEPTHTASEMLYVDPVQLCEGLSKIVRELKTNDSLGNTNDALSNGSRTETGWLDQLQNLNRSAQQEVLKQSQQFETKDQMFEGRVFTELMQILPARSTLFVGNSMPVRDLDTFFMKQDQDFRVLANRGANGIDGIVSSALGVSTVTEPLVLVIGDLSFYHDLNGLLAAKLHQLNCTIVVIHNDGGGIFSFLPQARHPKHFETLFGTPLSLDYRGVVEMYDGSFNRVENWESFREAVSIGIETGGLNVVEVRSERTDNVKLHQEVWEAANRAMTSYLKPIREDGQSNGN